MMNRSAIGVALCVVLTLATSCGSGSNGSNTTSNSFTLKSFPSGYNVPASAETVDTWVATGNTGAIRQHAWDIWAGLTTSSGEYYKGRILPIWETWYSPDDIYTSSGTCLDVTRTSRISPFQEPHVNFKHGQADDNITSFNKYNELYAQSVCDNQYNVAQTLTTLNTSFNTSSAPLTSRTIQGFPLGTIATKPVLMIVAQTGLTSIPYWNGYGADATTNTDFPSSGTWKQCVAVDPTNKMTEGSIVTLPCNGVPTRQFVVHLSNFYSFALTAADIANESNDATQELAGANAGDYVALVAMHVTAKENSQWSWQTFWWVPDPNNTPAPSEPRTPENISQLSSPWAHYTMCTAYQMVTPEGDPNGTAKVCFNPYLEPGLPDVDGKTSNCMTCHSLASWGEGGQFGGGLNYQANGYVAADNPEFGTVTRLDFLWSVTRATATQTSNNLSRALPKR